MSSRSEKLVPLCKDCVDWKWTHNTWGDCENELIAHSPESLQEASVVEICTIPRSEKVHLATEENFGCILHKEKK